MEILTTKVTRINNKYHCRLLNNKLVCHEVVCKEKKDISFCVSYMLRWFDKYNNQYSKMARASRERATLKPRHPIGKIWYKIIKWRKNNHVNTSI